MSPPLLIRIFKSRHVLGKGALFAAAACAAMAGCSSSTPVAYQGLMSAQQFQPVKDDEKPFQYRNYGSGLKNYTKILIDPVTIYAGGDAQFESVSLEDRHVIADYMKTKFAEVLGDKFEIVQIPDPATIRLHLTLAGMEKSTPVLSTISHVSPVGLAINGGLQAAGRNGTNFGSVSYAVELSDTATSQLLYAYVTKQTPDALDITASIGTLDATKEGIRIGASHLREDLSKMGFASAASR